MAEQDLAVKQVEPVVDDPILDAEHVWRRVLPNESVWKSDSPNRISASYFSDRNGEPSVDRVKLVPGGEPTFTQQGEQNAVLELNVGRIRNISFVGKNGVGRVVDVEPDPIEPTELDPSLRANPAHCLLKMSPVSDHHRSFEKMREALVVIASWKIPPPPSQR